MQILQKKEIQNLELCHVCNPLRVLSDSLVVLLKGGPQNRGLFDRKFKMDRIGRFWRFQRDWTRKICGIM